MATSTYMTFVMHQKTPAVEGTEAVWEKLIDITEFPDLGTDPEMLETTTLSDRMQTFIMGIQGNEAMTFNTIKISHISKLSMFVRIHSC